MGVPAFFRWLSRKYPSIVVPCDETANGEASFDNVYLDMNGIIHPCTHPEHRAPPETEEEMFDAIFEYIERLMKVTRPRKLLYMAVDGVAPRAKMNQQRSRRFRASKESLEKEVEIAKIKDELREKGVVIEEKEKKKGFDSNVITPGTDFMISLSKALRQWIDQKLSVDNPDEDGIWPKDLVVILSDASVPGEGEHKIIDYIRKQKAQENYNPNISHLLCGADADLIMLALATHELDFTILREEFIPNQPRPCEICGQYGHEMKECTGSERDQEQPDVVVTEPGFIFIRISVLREYLQRECGHEYDLERFIDDFVFLCFFVGNDFLPHLPSLEIREGAIDRLLEIYRDIMASEKSAGTKRYLTCDGFVDLHQAQAILMKLGEIEDDVFKRRQVDQKRFKERQKRQKMQRNQYASYNVPWMRPQNVLPFGHQPEAMRNVKQEASRLRDAVMQSSNQAAAQQFKAMLKSPETGGESGPGKRKFDEMNDSDSEVEDDVMLGSDGWKARYYYHKFDSVNFSNLSRNIAREYVIGLCWVLRYYYQGCPDWKWFYPFHYAPFASDFVDIADMKVEFDSNSKPFRPLEQLMSVFPAASSANLPPSWRRLMTDSKSPIIDFYPTNFRVDLNGKHAAWMGVSLLPFIDEERMFSTLQTVYPDLTDSEKDRNSIGSHLLFASREKREFASFVKTLSETDEKGTVVPPDFDIMFGEVKLHNKYSKLYVSTVCVEYYDPSYPKNFVFPARRLKNAICPPNVLKPEDFDHSKDTWRPVIGLQRSNQRASLDNSARRTLNHTMQRGRHQFDAHHQSGYSPAVRYQHSRPVSQNSFYNSSSYQNPRFQQNQQRNSQTYQQGSQQNREIHQQNQQRNSQMYQQSSQRNREIHQQNQQRNSQMYQRMSPHSFSSPQNYRNQYPQQTPQIPGPYNPYRQTQTNQQHQQDSRSNPQMYQQMSSQEDPWSKQRNY